MAYWHFFNTYLFVNWTCILPQPSSLIVVDDIQQFQEWFNHLRCVIRVCFTVLAMVHHGLDRLTVVITMLRMIDSD